MPKNVKKFSFEYQCDSSFECICKIFYFVISFHKKLKVLEAILLLLFYNNKKKKLTIVLSVEKIVHSNRRPPLFLYKMNYRGLEMCFYSCKIIIKYNFFKNNLSFIHLSSKVIFRIVKSSTYIIKKYLNG